jgi:hypothetical protein
MSVTAARKMQTAKIRFLSGIEFSLVTIRKNYAA